MYIRYVATWDSSMRNVLRRLASQSDSKAVGSLASQPAHKYLHNEDNYEESTNTAIYSTRNMYSQGVKLCVHASPVW